MALDVGSDQLVLGALPCNHQAPRPADAANMIALDIRFCR
jgi:hypothetical protein